MRGRPCTPGALLLLGLVGAACASTEGRHRAFLAKVVPRATEVPAPWVEVPMDLGTGMPIVGMRIGEHVARMILDTGFEYTILAPRFAATLGLASAGTVDQGGVERQLLRLPRLELGGACFSDVLVVVSDLPGIPGANADGILGLSTFAHAVLELDGPARRVRIGRDPMRVAADGRTVFAYLSSQFRPEVPMVLGDRAGRSLRCRMLVDSGYTGELELPAAITEVPFAADDLGIETYDTMWGKSRSRSLRLQATARVGDVGFQDPCATLFVDGWQWPHRDIGLLGSGLLSQIVVRIDPTQRLVQFVDPARAR